MPRIRYIKPEFFTDEDIAELSFEARLLFQGLWCYADKEGRLEDRPKFFKITILPYDAVNIDKLLNSLASGINPFIIRYKNTIKSYIQLINFTKHQKPHHTEKDSIIPEYNKSLDTNKLSIKKKIMEKIMEKGMEKGSVHKASTGLKNSVKTVKPPLNNSFVNEFETFYKAYPKKQAPKVAKIAWLKHTPPLGQCLKTLSWQKLSEDWIKEKGKYIPMPATWLNQGRWQDEEPSQQSNNRIDWSICDSEIKKIMNFYVNKYLPALYSKYTEKAYQAFLSQNQEDINGILAQCETAELSINVIEGAEKHYAKSGAEWTLRTINKNCADFLNEIKRRQEYAGTK